MMTCTLCLQVHKIVTSFKQLNLSYFLTLDICCWLSLKQGSLIRAASRLSACLGCSSSFLARFSAQRVIWAWVSGFSALLCVCLFLPWSSPAPTLHCLNIPASNILWHQLLPFLTRIWETFQCPLLFYPPQLCLSVFLSLCLSLTGLVTAGCPQVSAQTICPALSSPSSCYKGLQSMGIPP